MEELIRKQSEQFQMPLPEKIANAPELNWRLGFFWKSFQDLNTCRTFNGTISYMDIEMYAVIHGIDGNQKEDLHYMIRAMDNVYIDFRSKKDKRK